MKKKILFRWLKLFILIYCIIGIAVYYLQDKILFHPQEIKKESPYNFTSPFREVNVPYTKKSNINIIEFAANQPQPKGVVLYFHGNKENIAHYAKAAPDFTSRGYDVWMIDYPGFGKSTGAFTEKQLYDWSLVFYRLAQAKYSKDSIIIYGKSMGTGIAAQLATQRDCKSLILESPYYSFPSLIGSWLPIWPVNNMIKFKIPTWQYLKENTNPVIIFHGTSDNTIPLRNCNKLKPFLKPQDVFVTIEGAKHNDIPTFQIYKEKLDSLLR